MTLSEITELFRWGWAHDRSAAPIPFFMLAAPMVAGLLLEGVM